MRIRTACIAALSMALAGSLAACGGGGAESTGAAPNPTESVTLTYWASNQGSSVDADRETLAPLLAQFENETGVAVELEVIGWGDLATRIQTAVTSGQAPDLVNIGNTWAVSLQSTGAFMEFGDAEMAAVGGADKFVEAALATSGAPGTTPTSIPIYGLSYGLYYNKTMFADAGLQPPTTWDELVSVAHQLTDPASGVYGLTLAAGNGGANAQLSFIFASQNGAELFDADGVPAFTQPGVVDGVDRLLDLMRSGVVNASDAQFDSTSKSQNAFATGKAAMLMNSSSAEKALIANGMESGDWGVVTIPWPVGGEAVSSHVGGINLSIFETSKHKEQALAFIEFMTREATQKVVGKPFSVLPVLKGMEASFTDDAERAAVFTKVYNEHAKPLPLVPIVDQYEATVGAAVKNLFSSIATGQSVDRAAIEQALADAQSQVKVAR